MSQFKVLLLLIPSLLAAPLARAANMEGKEREARTACLAGDPTKGVQLLSELFVDTKEPTYIFNQGRCFEQNRRYDDAIGRFEEYLRAGKKLAKAEKAEAEKHIADCERSLAKQRSQKVATTAPQPSPIPQVTVEPVAAAPVEQNATTLQQSNLRPVSESSSSLRTAGIISAVVGGAAIVAGIIFNAKANGVVSDMKGVDGYTSGKESDHSTYQTLGWVGYGAGAACVASGAVLYILGLRSNAPASTSVGFSPALGLSKASVMLKGTF
jgi:hypothetical protein